jgi:hypothetical protein
MMTRKPSIVLKEFMAILVLRLATRSITTVVIIRRMPMIMTQPLLLSMMMPKISTRE